jgi:hypothetical protein
VAGEENSNDTWLGLYRHTGLKLKRKGVAVVRLDHSGKDETKGTRGGSAKSGDVDAIWKLTRLTDERYRLECTDSRMPVSTKLISLDRAPFPGAGHTVVGYLGENNTEARVRALVALCDSNGLPADANRETVRALAKARGMGAGNEVLAEVVKRRKTVLNPQDSLFPSDASEAVPNAGDSGDGLGSSEHEITVPTTRGQSGTAPIGPPVPASSSLREDAAGPFAAIVAELGVHPCCGRLICDCEAVS